MKKRLICCIAGISLILASCTSISVSQSENTDNRTINSIEKNETALYVISDFLDKIYSAKGFFNMSFNAKIPNDIPEENHAFIILGYALSDDGKMQQPLLNRLEVALKATSKYPNSKIIVSGGVPKRGIIEADVMHDWLVANEINESRIIKETSATDTVANAIFSLDIIRKENVKDITLITSASHMRRALIIFNEVNRNFGYKSKKSFDGYLSHIVYMDYDSLAEAQTITTKEEELIYRDLIRASDYIPFEPAIQYKSADQFLKKY